jgi:uncharacterized protein
MLRRVMAGVLLAVAVLAAAAGWGRLGFDTDPLSMLPPDLPEVKGLRAFQDAFASEGGLVILIEGSEEDAGLLGEEAASLSAALEASGVVGRARWQPRWAEQGEGLAELLAYLWMNGPVEESAGLAGRFEGERAGPELAAAVERVATALEGEDLALKAHDPLGFLSHPSVALLAEQAEGGAGGLESEDGRAHLVLAEAGRPIHGYKEAGRWLEEVRAVVEEWAAGSEADVVVSFTGEPVFASEIGGSMEGDMSGTVGMTAVLIGLLFWWMQRRLALLAGLGAVLAVVFVTALGLAGWIYGELSIMAAGFAAILIGLTVDYGVLICQEAKLHPQDRRGLAGATRKSIGWAAATTAVVFLALNGSALPGIAQLGTMVACGILAGALLMLGGYLPFVARVAAGRRALVAEGGWILPRGMALAVLGMMLVGGMVMLMGRGLPEVGFDTKLMHPRNSEAMAAFERMGEHFPTLNDGGVRLIVSGEAGAVPAKLAEAERRLAEAESAGLLERAVLPVGWWPDAGRQQANRAVLGPLAADAERLLREADEAGFAEEGLALGRAVLMNLQRQVAEDGLIYPQTADALEMMRMFVSREPDGSGSVVVPLDLVGGSGAVEASHEALRELSGGGIWVVGWDLLKPAVRPLVRRDLLGVFLPMGILMVVMLVAVFRSWREVVAILGAMGLAGVMLLASMAWWGIGWNFINIAATPLLLGTGIDYGIHVMLALRRNGGDLAATWHGTGKAVLFCGCSTAIGFGSLCFASNEAMASLGAVAVMGILLTMSISVFLLPVLAGRPASR